MTRRGAGGDDRSTAAVRCIRADHRCISVGAASLARMLALAVLAFGGITSSGAADAQTYPTRTVRLILPSPPGGGTDVVAHTLAQKLTEALGQTFIVENKPGASGTIGAGLVAKAAADGYTLMISASVHLINALILKQVPYDAVADFTPITQIAEVPLVVIVHPSVKAGAIGDLAKKNSGADWNWAVAAIGSPDHLVAESMRQMLGLALNVVPYRGMGAAIADTVTGQVAGMTSPVLPVIAQIRDGRVRPLAVTTTTRNVALPDVPTLAESGMTGFTMTSWYGLWGPRDLPGPIAERLAEAARKGFQDADIKTRFPPESFQVICSTPAEFARTIEAETARYARIVHDAKISAD